jgi:hypothetical protein
VVVTVVPVGMMQVALIAPSTERGIADSPVVAAAPANFWLRMSAAPISPIGIVVGALDPNRLLNSPPRLRFFPMFRKAEDCVGQVALHRKPPRFLVRFACRFRHIFLIISLDPWLREGPRHLTPALLIPSSACRRVQEGLQMPGQAVDATTY